MCTNSTENKINLLFKNDVYLVPLKREIEYAKEILAM